MIYFPALTGLTLLLMMFMPFGGLRVSDLQHVKNEQTDIQVSMACLGGNSFEIALSKGNDAESLPFARPVVLEISIEDESPIILSADGADTVDIVFNSTGKQAYQFDELTLPPEASNDYALKIGLKDGEETTRLKDVELSVAVGCSDAAKDNLMECFITCNTWMVSW